MKLASLYHTILGIIVFNTVLCFATSLRVERLPALKFPLSSKNCHPTTPFCSSRQFNKCDFAPLIQFSMMIPWCQIYLSYLPLYQQIFPGEQLSFIDKLADMREYLVEFAVAGIMNPSIDDNVR